MKAVMGVMTAVTGSLLGTLFLGAPGALYRQTPLAPGEVVSLYRQAAVAVQQETAALATTGGGVLADWHQVIALDAGLRQQHFDGVTRNDARTAIWQSFVVTHTEVSCPPVPDPAPTPPVCVTIITFSLRTLEEAMHVRGLSAEDQQWIRTMHAHTPWLEGKR